MARRTLAVCFALWLLFLAAPCFAGMVHVEDPEQRFDASTETSIVTLGPSLPFDAVVLVTSKPASVAALDSFVGAHVGAPNLVVVGVDPVNRRSSVHFGTGVGVARSDFKSVEQAGIPAFKRRDWGGGVRAILERANAVRSAPAVVTTTAAPWPVRKAPPVAVPSAPVERKGGSSDFGAVIAMFGFLLLVSLVLVVVVGAIVLALRAAWGRGSSSGVPNYGSTGYGAASGGYPSPFRHGYSYSEGPHPANSTLGTVATHGAAAVAGAAVGYAAGRYLDSDSSSSWDNSSSSSWDNSSSSSAWESSSPTTSSWDNSSTSDSSSSSWDSGGSSSSWDSGGSSDFGGGGSDFGGGGSDWS